MIKSDLNFGERLKNLRTEKKLSMKQLGKAISVSGTSICKWEKNLSEPKLTHILSLSDFFDCSADFLIGKTDEFGYPLPDDPMNLSVNQQEIHLIHTYRNLPETKQKLLISTAKAWETK